MSSCVLSDEKILKEIKEGHIVIEPFNEKNLNNCSYNVTLSEYFFREVDNKEPFNPWQENNIAKHWQIGEVEVSDSTGDKFIRLAPSETILIATNEFIGGKDHITTMVKGRSSCGRSLLSVCAGAGWGDVGYINRWTLMVTSLSRFADLIIPVGSSIAQIVFLETGQPRSYYQGKYQGKENSIQELKKSWSPRMMLPQFYKENEKAELNTIQHQIK